MNCYHCNGDVIWQGDHDFEDYNLPGDGIVSNLICTACDAIHIVYKSNDKKENDK